MRKINNLIGGLLISIMVSFVACEEEETNYYTWADAIISCQHMVDSIAYAPAFMVYSFQPIEEAIVYYANNSESKLALTVDSDNPLVAAYSPSRSLFRKTLPEYGDVNFEVKFKDGEEREAMDRMFDDVLLPPVVTDVIFNEDLKRLRIDWLDVESADAYNISLAVKNGGALFYSGYFSTELSNYLIGEQDYRWVQLPENGDTLVVRVEAILFEPFSSASDQFNVQCISFNQNEEVIWKY